MNVTTLISQWQGKRILIVGDIMLDRYLHGQTHRISPEAPVPIVNVSQEYDRLGGAANVALNLKALGVQPQLMGVIGNDAAAEALRALCQTHGLDTSTIITDTHRPTTVKTRIWAGGKQLLRLDKEQTSAISSKLENEILRQLQEQLPLVDALIFQDYNKGVLTPRIISSGIQWAEKWDCPSVADPKVDNFWAYRGITLFKPNLKEIRQQCPFPISPQSLATLQQAAAFIQEKIHPTTSMITLSEHGIYLDDGQKHLISPILQHQEIVDVCGAGDTVLSVATLALLIGLPIEEMGVLANLAGGLACAKSGVVPVSKDELSKWGIK